MADQEEHLKLLREMRDSLRKLPDELVHLLGKGPGGGLFPEGEPAPWQKPPASGKQLQTPEEEEEAGKQASGAKVRALENAGFALGRFIQPLAQLAGFSRDIRAVMESLGALKGTREQLPPSPLGGGAAREAKQQLAGMSHERDVIKAFTMQEARRSAPTAATFEKMKPPEQQTPRPPVPLPKFEEQRRAAGAPPLPVPSAIPPQSRAYFDPDSPLYPAGRSGQGIPTAATFENRPPTTPPRPQPTIPTAATFEDSRPRPPGASPSPMEGFSRTGTGGTPPGAPPLSGGVGQQVVAKLDQLIALATGQQQQQMDEASDTPDDKTRHTEDLGDDFGGWPQRVARQQGGVASSGMLPAALVTPNPGKGGSGAFLEAIMEKIAMAAITAGLP